MDSVSLEPDAPMAAAGTLDLTALEPYLRQHCVSVFGSIEPRQRLTAQQFGTGYSNRTYLLGWGAAKCVLRCPPPPPFPPGTHDMRREHRVLEHLHPAYPLAPAALHLCRDRSVLGEPFLLMQWRAGRLLSGPVASEIEAIADGPRQLCDAFVRALVELHKIEIKKDGLGTLALGGDFLARHIAGLHKRWLSVAGAGHDVDQLAQRLNDERPHSNAALMIHNDFKFDNVLIELSPTPSITAVLDWELSTIGDPIVDVGMALAYWQEPADATGRSHGLGAITARAGWPSRRELFEAYRARRPLDADMLYCEALGLFQLAVIVEQLARSERLSDPRHRALSGKGRALLAAALSLLTRSPSMH